MKRIGSLLFVLIVFLAGCGSNDNSNPMMSNSGTVQVLLTGSASITSAAEGPVSPKEVWVNIGQIDAQAGKDGAWLNLSSKLQMIDLMSLTGVQGLLGSGSLPNGTYSGLRLFIESGYAIDDAGARHDLKVPSDKIEVPVVFEVKQNQVTKVVLDIDGKDSVQVVATGGKNEKWILRPVLKVASVENGQ